MSAAGSRRRQAGFTLLEVMIALVILAIGLLSAVRLVPIGSHHVAHSMERSRASQLTAARAERVLTTPYADPDLDAGTHADDENPLEGSYYVTWSVEDDQPISGCKRVTVSTRWPSATAAILARSVVVVPRTGG